MGEIEIGDLIVEWDDNKAELNWKKHGIRFEKAAEIFLDEFLIDYYDEGHSDYEDRIKVIGMVEKVLVVIYTERGENYQLSDIPPLTEEELARMRQSRLRRQKQKSAS